jgi:hypothetical protein
LFQKEAKNKKQKQNKKLSYNIESFQRTKFLSFAAFFFSLFGVANSNSMAKLSKHLEDPGRLQQHMGETETERENTLPNSMIT